MLQRYNRLGAQEDQFKKAPTPPLPPTPPLLSSPPDPPPVALLLLPEFWDALGVAPPRPLPPPTMLWGNEGSTYRALSAAPRPPHWRATPPATAPSLPLLRSPPHQAPAESATLLTPPTAALPSLPMPSMALYVLAALEAVTIILWRPPWQCPYPYIPSPTPSKPHPAPFKTCPSPPPFYKLPLQVWPMTTPTPPPDTAEKPW
ncbi:hypothetical protein E4T56_gene600 [Termitomyces sp. T112]|nr:hypothetical protein E4T56_gene600 [Termitomyces sp. T112]